MVEGRRKSHTYRRKKVVTPGGRTVTHYVRRKPKLGHCADCGMALKGVPRELPYKMQNMPKTQKRPQRPFGGMLCSKCSREKIKSMWD